MRIVLDSKTINKCFTKDADGLLRNIIEICDVICLTEKIQKEYEKPGYFFDSLIPELESLENRKPIKLERIFKLGPKPIIKEIKASHRAFIEDAVRINASYFITEENLAWLKQGKNIKEEHGLIIATPEQYIKQRKKAPKK